MLWIARRVVSKTTLCRSPHTIFMGPRTLDILTGLVTFVLFILFLLAFPSFLDPGLGYMLAILLFVIILSVSGYFIKEKIN